MDKKYKCLLISDFTINNLAGILDNDKDFPEVESVLAPFNQVIQVLTDKNLACWESNPDFVVVWTQPESTIESFNRLINFKPVSMKNIWEEVDEYSSLLLTLQSRTKFIFVPTWVFPSYHRGFGMLDMKTGRGISNTLMRMNLRLAENLDKGSGFYLFDSQRWVNTSGRSAFNPKLWYMGKIAYGNAVFLEAAKDIKCALRGISGQAKKLIILDADDTLWGGIVGEAGWEELRLLPG